MCGSFVELGHHSWAFEGWIGVFQVERGGLSCLMDWHRQRWSGGFGVMSVDHVAGRAMSGWVAE